MTTSLANRLQAWFTSTMPATKTRRETTDRKAQRLIAEGRYRMHSSSHPPGFWIGTCEGDHGVYEVFAISQEFMDRHGIDGGRVACTCQAGWRRKLCAHAKGAEELRKQGDES